MSTLLPILPSDELPGRDRGLSPAAKQAKVRELWNGEAHHFFCKSFLAGMPPLAWTNCGLRWSL
jgi:hypothetical protein